MTDDHTQTLIDHALSGAPNLYREFKGIYSEETIQRFLLENAELLKDCKVTHYLPIFAYRFTHDRLTAMGQVAGHIPKHVPEVLFVCVQNAGRSQMAAALLDAKAKGKVHVRSAGSAPAGSINKTVTEAMAELGVDLGKEFPKPMTDDIVRAADAVITMGCGDACPIYPGKKYEDWDLQDPAGQDLETVRKIRDDIARRVDRLIVELAAVRQSS
ncbi:MAG TPA: arsenate reductase ArsC [Candidatus Binatus sp.]|nr:arsenate reductase ArsC [Candidatus Binatus sp.]